MANGILNVLSNVRKLSQGLLDGTQELYNPYTGEIYKQDEDAHNLKDISYKVKPFVVSSEFLRLSSSLTMPDSANVRALNSEENIADLTDKENMVKERWVKK